MCAEVETQIEQVEQPTPPKTAECPNCGKQYRLFDNPLWKGDQSICQACADEAIAPQREIMGKIERTYAMAELRKQIGDEEVEKIADRERARIEDARQRRLTNG